MIAKRPRVNAPVDADALSPNGDAQRVLVSPQNSGATVIVLLLMLWIAVCVLALTVYYFFGPTLTAGGDPVQSQVQAQVQAQAQAQAQVQAQVQALETKLEQMEASMDLKLSAIAAAIAAVTVVGAADKASANCKQVGQGKDGTPVYLCDPPAPKMKTMCETVNGLLFCNYQPNMERPQAAPPLRCTWRKDQYVCG